MPKRRPLPRLPLWIALFAMLLGALLPARAVPVDEAYGLLGLDICAARWAGERSDPAGPQPMQHTGDHCPACWLGHAVALPTTPALWHLPAVLAHEAPPQVFSAPRPLLVWLQARSRAPPAAA